MAQESPNSNSANQNSTNKMLSTLLVKNAKPPIEVVLEYYSQKKKKIEEELIGDENDPVKIATQFSLLALAQTRSLLPIGRGNVYEDIISSGGVSHMNSAFIRDTLLYVMRKEDSAVNVQAARNFRYIVQQNLKLEKMKKILW